MKLDIVFGIYKKLKDKPIVTAGEIANEWKISTRTAQKYLDKMSNALPILAVKNVLGGYKLKL